MNGDPRKPEITASRLDYRSVADVFERFGLADLAQAQELIRAREAWRAKPR